MHTKRDLFPYILVSLLAITLILLLLLDRRIPLFETPAGMVPFLIIISAIAVILGRFAMRSPPPRQDETVSLWLQWHRPGIIGGALTGLIFLGVYWAYDWPAPNRIELSERQVNQMCQIQPPVPDHLIIWTTPEVLSLVPEFLLIGTSLGLVVGLFFPAWHHLMQRMFWPTSQRWITHPYPSGVFFGLVFGALIGTWLCPIIFSISDGRPFTRISTSAISVFLAVSFYLLFEVARHRNVMTRNAYFSMASVLTVGLLLTSLVWFIDSHFGISAAAYCFFYSTWDTSLNTLKPGWLPAIAGAAYGAMCGAITMSVVSGYLIIRTILMRQK